MKSLIIFLAMIAPASAQTAWISTAGQPNFTNCCADGACWMERGGVCHSDPSAREEFSIKANGLVTGVGGAFITNSPRPTCDEGFTLVYISVGNPMCARELKEPSK